jgi:hypothetical protein
MVSAVLNDVKSCKILLKPLKLGYRFTDVSHYWGHKSYVKLWIFHIFLRPTNQIELIQMETSAFDIGTITGIDVGFLFRTN